MLSQRAKEKKRCYMREYMKEWRRKNPDKVRESNYRYWERQAEKHDEASNNAN